MLASADEVRATLDCRPYADDSHVWWVVSDLTPGLDGQPIRVDADHVLGVTPASTSLAQLTSRREVSRALDLGTGCGVQSLHLSRHAADVVATDVNPRALAITAFNAALNDIRVDLRDGSLWDPVADETFDLVATNPPFVISPATDRRLVYRDSGLPGDQVVEAIVRGAPAHLADHGWCQVVANWAIRDGLPWDERLAGWLTARLRRARRPARGARPRGVRRALAQGRRVGTAAPATSRRTTRGSAGSTSNASSGVGFGWINLRKGASAQRGPRAPRPPVRRGAAGRPGRRVLGRRPARRDRRGQPAGLRVDVVQETHGDPGAEHPETIVLRQRRGLCRARQVDTVEAALAGASDGELSVGQILDALALLLDRDRDELAASYLPVVRSLVRDGFLAPA